MVNDNSNGKIVNATDTPVKGRTVRLRSAVAVVIAVALVAGWLGMNWQTLGVAKQDFSSLNSLQATLKQKFDGKIDDAKLLDGAKQGLVGAAGDPYTVYLTKKAAQDLKDDLNGQLSGIGIEVGERNNHLVVIAPIADTPAAKAGLQAGDVIAKIDGADPSGLTLDQAVAKIRGAAGTKVTLTLVRGSGTPFDVTITRANITVASVTWKKEGDIGIITVARFGDDTVAKAQQAATELSAQGATKFVLDLRNNPGGYLQAAVGLSSIFMDKKVVVQERKGGKTIETLSTTGGGTLVGKPLVVLINSGSASASEITAGALHDQGVAKLVGEKSFGKGSVQEIINLADGGELKVTVAHWFTPKGTSIDKQGIAPDEVVKMTQADLDANADPQLERAKAILNQ